MDVHAVGTELPDGWTVAAVDSSLKRYAGDQVTARGVEYTLQKAAEGADAAPVQRKFENWGPA